MAVALGATGQICAIACQLPELIGAKTVDAVASLPAYAGELGLHQQGERLGDVGATAKPQFAMNLGDGHGATAKQGEDVAGVSRLRARKR